MLTKLRFSLFTPQHSSLIHSPIPPFHVSFTTPLSLHVATFKTSNASPLSETTHFAQNDLFIPPGVDPEDITPKMILPRSNIVIGPYAGDSKVNTVEFVKSSNQVKDCPKDHRPEFAVVGKTRLINHFLVNKSWYIVDLPGYGFANAPEAAKMDWFSFTKGYFLNRETLVSVLLLVDASVPPQKIDLDCANWLGRSKIPMTFVFTKCDKMKGGKTKPDENIREFQELIRQNYKHIPPWILTSSVTGLGRDGLLLHMSQLRNYWDSDSAD
nr:GTP-binding protein At2g22870 [Ipomoea batatas]